MRKGLRNHGVHQRRIVESKKVVTLDGFEMGGTSASSCCASYPAKGEVIRIRGGYKREPLRDQDGCEKARGVSFYPDLEDARDRVGPSIHEERMVWEG
jgi:hypothetical protein